MCILVVATQDSDGADALLGERLAGAGDLRFDLSHLWMEWSEGGTQVVALPGYRCQSRAQLVQERGINLFERVRGLGRIPQTLCLLDTRAQILSLLTRSENLAVELAQSLGN